MKIKVVKTFRDAKSGLALRKGGEVFDFDEARAKEIIAKGYAIALEEETPKQEQAPVDEAPKVETPKEEEPKDEAPSEQPSLFDGENNAEAPANEEPKDDAEPKRARRSRKAQEE